MAGDLEQFVKNTVQKMMTQSYPHLKLPAIVAATIITAQPLVNGWSEYTIQILTEAGSPDTSFPEIPNVPSRLSLEVGRTVAVGLLYGMLSPVLICEVRL